MYNWCCSPKQFSWRTSAAWWPVNVTNIIIWREGKWSTTKNSASVSQSLVSVFKSQHVCLASFSSGSFCRTKNTQFKKSTRLNNTPVKQACFHLRYKHNIYIKLMKNCGFIWARWCILSGTITTKLTKPVWQLTWQECNRLTHLSINQTHFFQLIQDHCKMLFI